MIPTGYPDRCSLAQLQGAIGELSRMLSGSPDINSAIRWSPLLQLGVNELQNRRMRRWNLLSFGVAVVALAISLISGVLSSQAVRYARDALHSTDRWQKSELALLEKLREDTSALRDALEKIQVSTATGRGSVTVKPRR